MKDKAIKNIAFSKYTPSAFFVRSPFQLLCAMGAIRDFSISEYRIVFVCYEGFEKRNNQMKSMAMDFGVEYDYYTSSQYSFEQLASDIDSRGMGECNKYSRIFIGDYYILSMLELSIKYAAKRAVLLYMDDGNSSITLLQGIRRDDRPSNWRLFFQWYKNDYKKEKSERLDLYKKLENRGVICSNCFYTIYSDIKSKKFILYPNMLNGLTQQFSDIKCKGNMLYVVGPAIEAYAKQNRIRIVDVESIMWNKLSELRSVYPNNEIVYIPHGRDENKYVMEFCQMLNIKYKPIDETIEYHLVKRSSAPYAVYGINSTALLNIKRIYPDTIVVNWFLDKKYNNSFYSFFKAVAVYYKKNGIIIDIIKYPGRTIKENCKCIYNNVYSLVSLFFKKIGI